MDSTTSVMKFQKDFTLIMKGNIIGINQYEVIVHFECKLTKGVGDTVIGSADVNDGQIISNKKNTSKKSSIPFWLSSSPF